MVRWVELSNATQVGNYLKLAIPAARVDREKGVWGEGTPPCHPVSSGVRVHSRDHME